MPIDPHAQGLIQSLCDEIFIADGGVDDFEDLTDAELYAIVYRELPRVLADFVVTQAREMQRRPYA
jgi:hypothetical protein